MLRRVFFQSLIFGASGLTLGRGAQADTPLVVITHPNLPHFEASALKRIYTGRQIELGGVPLVPINAPSGSGVRDRFLQVYVGQDDEKYVAYWTVRRYVGKGVPPKELNSAAEIIAFVQATLGAIAYVEASEIRPGLQLRVLR
jgi:ABC-type phosphate transport system substrate-binding protein